jgi:hypothetical protein
LTLEVEGVVYSPLTLHRVYDDPRPQAISVASLDGLIAYIESGIDNAYEARSQMVIVDSHDQVSLVTEVHGDRNERHTMAVARLDEVQRFPFGKWLGPDEFNIQIRSRFVENEDLLMLVEYVARIDAEAAATLTDDGVSQSTTVRRKVHGALRELQAAPSILTLQPFRTFTEIEQPASRFLFRMRESDGSVGCALFEADGGAWRQDARMTIKAYLTERLPLMLVLA